MNGKAQGFKDLLAYQKAFQHACDIFQISLLFPKDEKYSLTKFAAHPVQSAQIWQRLIENVITTGTIY